MNGRLSDEGILRVLHPLFCGEANRVPPFEKTSLTPDDIGIANRAIVEAAYRSAIEAVIVELNESAEKHLDLFKDASVEAQLYSSRYIGALLGEAIVFRRWLDNCNVTT